MIEPIRAERMGKQKLATRNDIAGGRRKIRGCHPFAIVDLGIVTDRPDCLKPLRAQGLGVDRIIVIVDESNLGAHHTLAGVLLQFGKALLKAQGKVVVVRIEDTDDITVFGRERHGTVDSVVRARVFLNDQLNAAIGKGANHLHRVVIGSIVNDEDTIRRARLAEHGLQPLGYVALVIVARNDDGEFHGLVMRCTQRRTASMKASMGSGWRNLDRANATMPSLTDSGKSDHIRCLDVSSKTLIGDGHHREIRQDSLQNAAPQ